MLVCAPFSFLIPYNVDAVVFSRILVQDGRQKPIRLPNSMLGWYWPLFNLSEDELLKVGGFDAVSYFDVIQFGFETFITLTLLYAVTVVPVNLSDRKSVV